MQADPVMQVVEGAGMPEAGLRSVSVGGKEGHLSEEEPLHNAGPTQDSIPACNPRKVSPPPTHTPPPLRHTHTHGRSFSPCPDSPMESMQSINS